MLETSCQANFSLFHWLYPFKSNQSEGSEGPLHENLGLSLVDRSAAELPRKGSFSLGRIMSS
jgi:hypothetical protein